MPTYEYRCQKCGKEFALSMSIGEHDRVMMVTKRVEERVRCPKCRSIKVEQQLGTFYAKTTKKS